MNPFNPLEGLPVNALRALAAEIDYDYTNSTTVETVYGALRTFLAAGAMENWTHSLWAAYQAQCFLNFLEKEAAGNINNAVWDAPTVRTRLIAHIQAYFNKIFLSNDQKNAFRAWEDRVTDLAANASLLEQFQCAEPKIFHILGY